MPNPALPKPALPWTGACRCGQVRLKVSVPPLLSMACHCTGCQRMTGGPYSLSVAIPTEGFEVTAGEPVIGGLHGPIRHYHCPYCMSWVFTRAEGLDWFVNVRTPMLDVAAELPAPFIETFTSEKLPWVANVAQRSYPAFPSMEEYGELTQAYMAQSV